MATLPNISEQVRATPQVNRGTVGYAPGQVGEAIANAGEVAGKAVEGYQEQQDKLDISYATADFLQRKVNAEKKATEDDNYTQYAPRFQNIMKDELKQSALMVRNPGKRAELEAALNLHVAQSLPGLYSQSEAKYKDVTAANAIRQGESLSEAYLAAKDPKTKAEIKANYHNILDASKHVLGAANVEKMGMEWNQKNAAITWDMRTDAEKLNIIKTAPVSVRNNNPGNLRGANGEFRKFDTPERGMKAMTDDLTAKVSGNSPAMKKNFGEGYKPTIENIIKTYAPATENDTEAYIKTVSSESGIPADQVLTAADIAKIQPAMIKVEGGNKSASYFAKTGTEFDDLSPEQKAKWVSPDQRKKLIQGVAINDMAADPLKFNADNYDLDPAEKVKLKEAANKAIEGQQEQARLTRLGELAGRNKGLYDAFLANDPDIMNKISNFMAATDDPKDIEFGNSLRLSVLKANPVSQEEQDQVYTDLAGRVYELGIKKSKSGKVTLSNDDAELADVVRLQRDIMKESARGVTRAKALLNQLTPAIISMSEKELGHDDIGWKFFGESREAYDTGYQVVQDFLVKQGKEKDLSLKAKMLSDFIDAADTIPDSVKGDPAAFETAVNSAANRVIAGAVKKGMPNIPIGAIQELKRKPETAAQFDEIFGAGAANRVLGK